MGRSPVIERAVTEFAIIDGQQVFGDGGGPSTYQGGMTLPGGWRAALLLSDLIGSFPWHAYRERAGNPIEMVTPTPPLLDQPNPEEPRMATFSGWALDLVWHGNAIGLVSARNAEGHPTAVVPVPARMVGVRRVGVESLSQLPIGAIEYQIGSRTFGAGDMIHIKGPCEPGAVRGLGVLEAHLNGILELSAEQLRQAKQIAYSGVPTGKLTTTNPDATPAQMKESKEAWLQAQRDRTVAALSPSTDFEAIAWNPEQMQLVEARRYSLTDLALVFGLPARYLLAESGSSMTYSTLESERLDLLQTSSLVGHLARFEQTLGLAFPRGTTVKANLDSWLRGDTTTRYNAHQTALNAGFLTVDEVRATEDLPPMPEPPDPPEPPEPPTDPDPDEDEDDDEESNDE